MTEHNPQDPYCKCGDCLSGDADLANALSEPKPKHDKGGVHDARSTAAPWRTGNTARE